MRKKFRLTIFKKTFLIIFCGFLAIEGNHIYLDYKNELDRYAYSSQSETMTEKMIDLKKIYSTSSEEEFKEAYFKAFEDTFETYISFIEKGSSSEEYEIYKSYYCDESKNPVLVGEYVDKDDRLVKVNTDEMTRIEKSMLEYQLIAELDEDKNKRVYIQLRGNEKKSDVQDESEETDYIEIEPTYLSIDGDVIIDEKNNTGSNHDIMLKSYTGKIMRYNYYNDEEVTYDNYEYKKQKLENARSYAILKDGIYGASNYGYVIHGQDLITVQYYYFDDIENVDGRDTMIRAMHYYENGMSEILNVVVSGKKNVYIAAFGLSIIIAIIISHLLTDRIKKIDAVTKKIAHNQFDEKLDVTSQDELGNLSHNINLMSTQLKQTIEQLNNEINRVKKLEGLRKEFIANFTHEIKTPLGIISGYIELIEESQDEKKIKQYLSAIDQETKKINDLVLAMLNLSRLESGKVELKIEEVDIDDLVSSVIDSYATLLEKKKIQIQVHGNSFSIECDRNQITMVIHNFISNAIKHTPEEMNIHITYQDYQLSIENEGSYINDENMEAIWDTYVSSDREGTGLGLAICKAVLDLHRFEYGVYNTDRGVCFYFKANKDC